MRKNNTDNRADTSNHPAADMRKNAQHLHEQALFAKKQAQASASRAQQAATDIANLNIDEAFSQLHKMIEMVGGKSRHAKIKTSTNVTTLPMAAE